MIVKDSDAVVTDKNIKIFKKQYKKIRRKYNVLFLIKNIRFIAYVYCIETNRMLPVDVCELSEGTVIFRKIFSPQKPNEPRWMSVTKYGYPTTMRFIMNGRCYTITADTQIKIHIVEKIRYGMWCSEYYKYVEIATPKQ